jgi:AraC-like DNA-binding protein
MTYSEPQIQTCTLQGLPEVLRAHGVAPAEFLARFGLTPEVLLMRNEHIAYRRYAEVLHGAAAACGVPHLGLELSRAASHRLYAEGTIGVLIKYCDTAGAMLEAVARYHHTVSGGADYRVLIEGADVFFLREGLVPGLKHDRILQDLSLADFVGILRKALGASWRPAAVMFSSPKPDDPRPYRRLLQAPVCFEAARQAIRFPAADLSRPVRATGAVRESLAREFVARSAAQADVPFARAVEQAIDLLLPTGVCCVNCVAAAFDLHPRTLHRRLKAESTSFAALLDERRQKHAAAYLGNAAMAIADVALALGYTAPEAFTRAFRRWHGMAPVEWRRMRHAAAKDSR